MKGNKTRGKRNGNERKNFGVDGYSRFVIMEKEDLNFLSFTGFTFFFFDRAGMGTYGIQK